MTTPCLSCGGSCPPNTCLYCKDEAQLRQMVAALAARADAAEFGRDEARKALALIGERAVCDFDDATVGAVDAVLRVPSLTYGEWIRGVMKAVEENRRLSAHICELEKQPNWKPGEVAAYNKLYEAVKQNGGRAYIMELAARMLLNKGESGEVKK